MENPFVQHRALLLAGGYSTSLALRQVALSLWNGNGYPFPLHKIGNMDSKHYQIFQDMLAWYRAHGEGCKDFMRLCSELNTIENVAEVVDGLNKSNRFDKRSCCPVCGGDGLTYKVMDRGRVQMNCHDENCGCVGFSGEGGGADEKVTAAWQDAGGKL